MFCKNHSRGLAHWKKSDQPWQEPTRLRIVQSPLHKKLGAEAHDCIQVRAVAGAS